MPLLKVSRQVISPSWFETAPGRILLRAEHALLASAALRRAMVQPWLWLRVSTFSALARLPSGSGLSLVRNGQRFDGDIRCGLHLPLATESIHAIVVQHCMACHPDDLLAECARVLKPGGRIWLFVLNPYSPYRLHWCRSHCQAALPSQWQTVLTQVGLTCLSAPQYVGPTWRPVRRPPLRGFGRPWQAACLLIAQKRTLALTPLLCPDLAWHKPVTAI